MVKLFAVIDVVTPEIVKLPVMVTSPETVPPAEANLVFAKEKAPCA